MSKTTFDSATATACSAELDEQQRCELLADERRRLAMSVLGDRTAALGLEELAAEVARREAGSNQVSEAVIKQVTVSLHHVHLPKLSEFGVISYEPECHLVTP